jgi:enoyl-CoA hydratase
MGHRAAAELILEGKSFSAEEALRAGFVNRITDDLDGEIWKLYEKLAHFSPTVLCLAKKALAGPNAGVKPGLKYSESIYLRELIKVKDMGEGLNAFLQKRAPVWSGK